jgi:hypothetical protein
MKNGVFWVVTPCGSCENRRIGGTWRQVFLRSIRRLLVAACVVPSSPIFVTLMMEEPGSSETSVLTRATRRNNPEDTVLHSHRRENLKSYITCGNVSYHLMSSLPDSTVRFIIVTTRHEAWMFISPPGPDVLHLWKEVQLRKCWYYSYVRVCQWFSGTRLFLSLH